MLFLGARGHLPAVHQHICQAWHTLYLQDSCLMPLWLHGAMNWEMSWTVTLSRKIKRLLLSWWKHALLSSASLLCCRQYTHWLLRFLQGLHHSSPHFHYWCLTGMHQIVCSVVRYPCFPARSADAFPFFNFSHMDTKNRKIRMQVLAQLAFSKLSM